MGHENVGDLSSFEAAQAVVDPKYFGGAKGKRPDALVGGKALLERSSDVGEDAIGFSFVACVEAVAHPGLLECGGS